MQYRKAALLCAVLTLGLIGAGCGDKSEDATTASGSASPAAPAEASQAVQQSQQAEQADAARRGAAAPKQP